MLLKTIQNDDGLIERLMQLAKQKQQELELLKLRKNNIESGKADDNQNAVKILELAQRLSLQYVAFNSAKKR